MPSEGIPNLPLTSSSLASPAEVDRVAKARKTESDAKETIGQRLARLRRERGITQVELAEKLGLAQPHISDYEHDAVRLNGQVLIQLNRILGVSVDELLGVEKPRPTGPIRNRRLLRRLQDLERLPRRDQQALLRTIDAFLAKAS
jgi:transcriptional regulator with XRE-family HTH domain